MTTPGILPWLHLKKLKKLKEAVELALIVE